VLAEACRRDQSFLDAVVNGVFTVPGDGCVDYRALLETLFASGANLLILPIQDAFGWSDRINQPATVGDHNWTWRLPWPTSISRGAPVDRPARSLNHLIRSLQGDGGIVSPIALAAPRLVGTQLGRLLDRQVAGLGALEDLVHVGRGAPKHFRTVRSIGHETPGVDIRPE
jgi:hypothetical protein